VGKVVRTIQEGAQQGRTVSFEEALPRVLLQELPVIRYKEPYEG
jgi:hypothetical protein